MTEEERESIDLKPTFPSDYVHAIKNGLADRRKTLRLSFYRWLTPESIQSIRWPDYKLKSLVPFAVEPNRSSLCWSLDYRKKWVFYLPVDSDFAVGFAPNFSTAVYRAVLEDLSLTFVALNLGLTAVEFARRMRKYADLFADIWPEQWRIYFESVLARPAQIGRGGGLSFVSEREVKENLGPWLKYPMLGKRIRQHFD